MPYFHYRKRKTILSDCFGHVAESEEKPPRFAEAYTRLCGVGRWVISCLADLPLAQIRRADLPGRFEYPSSPLLLV